MIKLIVLVVGLIAMIVKYQLSPAKIVSRREGRIDAENREFNKAIAIGDADLMVIMLRNRLREARRISARKSGNSFGEGRRVGTI